MVKLVSSVITIHLENLKKMRKLIRKILKEDFDWVRDVVKKEYPIKLEVLMDYFGHDSMDPNQSLDDVDNYGELECYSLENNERWCVGTVDEAYKEFKNLLCYVELRKVCGT